MEQEPTKQEKSFDWSKVVEIVIMILSFGLSHLRKRKQ
jgi:hypothetical protein